MITILAIGKVRQQFVKSGIQEFLTRLQKYGKVEYREVDSFTSAKGYIIALDEGGTQYSSNTFAQFIKKKNLENKNITFLIGPAEGLGDVKRDTTISLSNMTYPTQLVRLIFIEQLYRAFTIIKNEPYHKN